MRSLIGIALATALIGCVQPPSPEQSPNPLEAPPVDSARIPSVSEAAAWAYHRETIADLDGDEEPERVVIAADVALYDEGLPLFEDGHRWAVYVEPPRGERTLLYAAFVPRGFAEAAVLIPDAEGRRRVLVQERTPERIRALEIVYEEPGKARLSSSAAYHIDQWLPGGASLP